jgi:hypothetical protein
VGEEACASPEQPVAMFSAAGASSFSGPLPPVPSTSPSARPPPPNLKKSHGRQSSVLSAGLWISHGRRCGGAGRRCWSLLPPRHALLTQRAWCLPPRREEVYICISSLLGRNFASPFALAVGGGNRKAQWPAGGKNAFASRCWTQTHCTNIKPS